jgi:hypothetical protein
LIEGFFSPRALTYSGTFLATLGGECLPKKALRFFCFSSVLGGYLCVGVRDDSFLLVAKGAKGHLPLDGHGAALKPIRDEDLVLVVVVTAGENIGPLDGLVKIAEDVVDDDDSLGRILGAGDILRRGELVGRERMSCM